MTTPASRVALAHDRPVRSSGDYVLVWMVGQRRTQRSFALDHAVDLAREVGRPVVVFEPLRAGYPWASDRLHRFVVEGMVDNAAACRAAGVTHYPYVEPEAGAGRGLLEALAPRACAVVTDEVPGFFQPRMIAAAAARLDVALHVVDGWGILPLRASPRAFPTAALFRRHLHKVLPEHLPERPSVDPLARAPAGAVDLDEVQRRWPAADLGALLAPGGLAALPIDHDVGPAAMRGGAKAAGHALDTFLERKLSRYHEDRSHPDLDCQSGLSPWLHFGHVSAHEVMERALEQDGWTPADLRPERRGNREGFWGASPAVEGFLDELVTWREVGAGFCFHRPDYAEYRSLPDWAQRTLAEHAGDPRPEVYSLDELEQARTEDRVWNAAQRQLVEEGRMHNYLRMLWGKKVLQWSPSPEEALQRLIHLNNKYAVDGRDPNSYSGIFWCFGRFDRAWGPERPIFGKVRYMTSESTVRKLKIKRYLDRWAPGDAPSSSGQLAFA